MWWYVGCECFVDCVIIEVGYDLVVSDGVGVFCFEFVFYELLEFVDLYVG